MSPRTLAQVSRRLIVDGEAGPWAAPPLPDLIARIDAALATRRGR